MDEIDHLMGKGRATLNDIDNALWSMSSDFRDLKDDTERKIDDLNEILKRLDNNIRIIKDVVFVISIFVTIYLIGDTLDWTLNFAR